MKIRRKRKERQIYLSQRSYLEKVISRFGMDSAKPVSTPLVGHFRLSAAMSPSSDKEKMHMARVPYANAVDSLMYAMVCTRPNITQAVSVVSRYMAEPVRKH